MNSKNEILGRLREYRKPDQEYYLSYLDKDLFADFPDSSDNLLEIFSQQLNKLSGELHLVKNEEEIVKVLQHLLRDIEPANCKAHKLPLIEKVKMLNTELGEYLTVIDGEELSSEDYAKFEVGVTGADCLIARTGSVLVRTISAGGRRLSVLPPTHIVIAEEKQIVFSLEDAFKMLNANEDLWSYATIITGPSRTSDIEKQLVLGAHGPKRLIVLIMKS
jgi:L-lactate dehydrogenase complex protein LldG